MLNPYTYAVMAIGLNLMQVVTYAMMGNYVKALYWACPVILTACVTWGMK